MDNRTLVQYLKQLYTTELFNNFFFKITWYNKDYKFVYDKCFDGYLKDFLSFNDAILNRFDVPIGSLFRFYIQINSKSISCVYQEGLRNG